MSPMNDISDNIKLLSLKSFKKKITGKSILISQILIADLPKLYFFSLSVVKYWYI